MTNYEKIRNKTIRERAQIIGDLPTCVMVPAGGPCIGERGETCTECAMRWLNKEAE